MLTAVHGPSFLSGRGEIALEVLPFWLAHVPKQQTTIYFTQSSSSASSVIGPVSTYGVSVTPLLFRWNFMRQKSSRYVPWMQLGSGLLWTAKDFPASSGTPESNTSNINFTPQVAFGQGIFLRKNQSLNLAVKAIHISNAGLGNSNPGVNVTVQFSIGYSWWK